MRSSEPVREGSSLKRKKSGLKPYSRFVNQKGIEMIHSGNRIYYRDESRDIAKILSFNPETFVGWASLLCYQGTVFQMREVKFILLATGVLGLTVAVITSKMPSFASKEFNTDALERLVTFLMVFLAFMTGVFVNAAFARWQEILKQLFSIVDSVKTLYMDLTMHGAPQEALEEIRRWGLVSAWLTALEAPSTWEPPDWDEEFDDMQEDGLLTDSERVEIKKMSSHKASYVWIWITMKLRDLSEDGSIPARQTPAMVKMLDHCHEATTAMNSIFNLVLFQVPHQYMHMLAFLIHLFNIVNTVKCGVLIGASIAASNWSSMPDAMHGQVLACNLLFMLVAPLVYQSFLAVASDITIPFGTGSTDIPIRFLLDRFQNEILDIEEVTRNPVRGHALTKQTT